MMSGAFKPSLNQRRCRPGSSRIKATLPKSMNTLHWRSCTIVYTPKARQNAAIIGPSMNSPKNVIPTAMMNLATIGHLQDGLAGLVEQGQAHVAHIGGQS